MPIVTKCTAPGCETLTMGPLCIEHDHVPQALAAAMPTIRRSGVGVDGRLRRRSSALFERPALRDAAGGRGVLLELPVHGSYRA